MNPKQVFGLLVATLLLCPLVLADKITLTLDQQEYYFLVGEQATVSLHTSSEYEELISGTLQYTITQSANQGNVQYSNTNSQSSSFAIDVGENDIALNFGTSSNPLVMTADFLFSFNDGVDKEVVLSDITIHFVAEPSQQQNQQNQQSSTSQEQSQQQSQQSAQNTQQSQSQSPQQQMQQLLDQIAGQSQPQQSSTQQKLQNNQLAQDSAALKQQMQQQVAAQEQLKQEFREQLQQQPEFQQAHEQLTQQGYTQTQSQVDPTNATTGDFDVKYQNEQGQKASISGTLENGQVQSLDITSDQQQQYAIDQTTQDSRFLAFEQQLQEQGFSQQNIAATQEDNVTTVQATYQNGANQTATIIAHVTDQVNDVTLEQGRNYRLYWTLLLALLLGAGIWYLIKKNTAQSTLKSTRLPSKPFNYRMESKRLLDQSKKEFEKNNHKDAYGLAAQAVRLFLSYKYDLRKELTNDDLIEFLQEKKLDYKQTKQCFDLCSLVEFAKYEPNKKDFEKILKHANSIVR